jgi:YHS domain-containing protein
MNASESPGATFKDPVCGMEVNPESPFRATYKAREYLFCSRSCLTKFQEDPGKFSAAPPKCFHCPEHPEFRQTGPGKCPQCGLLLEEIKQKWVCPYHPEVIHGEPGVCPVYGMPLIPEPPGRFYSCTLHPEVKLLEPGKCPRCGLEMKPYWAPVVLIRPEWFCPQHPDLSSLTPGGCPECGRKMEPREVPVAKERESVGGDPPAGLQGPAEEVCPKCGQKNIN